MRHGSISETAGGESSQAWQRAAIKTWVAYRRNGAIIMARTKRKAK